jgi:trimeric autotransporter adhesin
LSSAPYAVYALGSSAAGLNGALPSANLTGSYTNVVNFNNGSDDSAGTFNGEFFGTSFVGGNFVGNFIGSGGGLDVWHLGGNYVTTPGLNFLGTADNQPLELKVNNARALRIEPNTTAPNIIGGSAVNAVASGAVGATIGGGGAGNYYGIAYTNRVDSNFGTVSGGLGNTIQGDGGTTGGGELNSIQTGANFATIGGGLFNTIQNNAEVSAIGGGGYNSIQSNSTWSVIAGGIDNIVAGRYAMVGGGYLNFIGGDNRFAVSIDFGEANGIASGAGNCIGKQAAASFIGGGEYNFIETNVSWGTISGGLNNSISAGNASIGGGYLNTIQINAQYSSIGGGYSNTIQSSSQYSAIGGGANNTIQSNGQYSAISGGFLNIIQTNALYGSVGGGLANAIQNNVLGGTIGGGGGNTIQPNAYYPTISGGSANTIQTSVQSSAIAGGTGNSIQADSVGGTIAGGAFNTIQNNTTYGTISGGSVNSIQSSTAYSTIAGGNSNVVAGSFSMAAGRNCNLQHSGSFMWSDGSLPFTSFSTNAFFALASRGFYLFTGSGVGVQVAAGGNAWSPISDRNVKENFKPVDCEAVLDKVASLPLTTWNLKTQPHDIRHIGPMAQDFKAAFDVGEDERHISTTDADGVALAAIQGLNRKLKDQESEITALKEQVVSLRKLLESMSRGSKESPNERLRKSDCALND